MKTTTVQENMTTQVIWVKKDATFRDMATALRKHPVSAFPVVDDGTVIGVVSEPGVISGIRHYRDQVKARGLPRPT